MLNSISIDSISYSTTYSTGYDTNKPAFQSNSERASGTIAAHMHMNNIEVIDANQLSKWANNADGNTSPEVQLAAKFMLANPGVYSKIEKNDNPDADGISGVHNFDQAALGKLNFGNPTARESGSPEQAQEASGVLNKYMQSKNMDAVDVNGLYALAINKDGNVPEDAQKAALFMLENPSVYVKIETSDNPNVDGISGRWNFEKFSKVKGVSVAQTNDAADAAGILVGFMDGKYSQLTMDQLKNLASNKEGNVPPNVQQAAKFMLDNPEIYKKIETAEGYPSDGTVSFEELRKTPEKGDLASQTKYAANVLLGFMDGKYSQLTMDQLKNLAGNKEGNVPPNVQQAAKFMLDNPEIYKKIETAEGYPSDGTVSFEELRKTPRKGDLAAKFMYDNTELHKILGGVSSSFQELIKSVNAAQTNDAADAAGILVGFMDGKYSQLTMDQLKNLASNKEGNVPPNVQQAAKFMLDNPEIYKKIETAEGYPSDGTVSFEELRKTPEKGDLASQTKYAANVLLGFMDGKYSQLTMDQLKNLASNKEGNVPPNVQQAAKFMLDNPEIYKKIETAEGYPSDGTVSFEELRKTPRKGDLAAQTKDAANVLEGFMEGRKYSQLTMDQLQNMAVNKEGNIPPNVQQAAKFMLANPEIYKKIETAEGAPSDGTVSLNELRQSQGKV